MGSRTGVAALSAACLLVAAMALGEWRGVTAEGKRTYQANCAACHDVGAHGAPRAGHAPDWEWRAQRGRENLYESALKGRTVGDRIMPPRGGNARLTDEQVRAAVDYLLEARR